MSLGTLTSLVRRSPIDSISKLAAATRTNSANSPYTTSAGQTSPQHAYKRQRTRDPSTATTFARRSDFGLRQPRTEGEDVSRIGVQDVGAGYSNERRSARGFLRRGDPRTQATRSLAPRSHQPQRPPTAYSFPDDRAQTSFRSPNRSSSEESCGKRLPNALHYDPFAPEPERSPRVQPTTSADRPPNRWAPTKKLSLPTMAGIRSLHERDPTTYTPQYLSLQFGVSYEAIKRILKSKFRDKQAGRTEADLRLTGTKWDPSPGTNPKTSPVPAIKSAFDAAVGREE